MIELIDVDKSFTIHSQNGVMLNVLQGLNLSVDKGECLVLDGPSGMGKSTVLKMIYGNYLANKGQILISPNANLKVDLTTALPRTILDLREKHMAYVSQFLRVVPRVSALDIVIESLTKEKNTTTSVWQDAQEQSKDILSKLNIPMSLWSLPPATFSGGEQQRINIARNLIKEKPILLLDEPTASLDKTNSRIVLELFLKAMDKGAAIIGIFHDQETASVLATKRLDMNQFRKNS